MNELQFCPICHVEVQKSPRYPAYVCGSCYSRASDKGGRLLSFSNLDMFGNGFKALYKDTGEPYNNCVCYIDGKKCWAGEAYFGGIVIEADKTTTKIRGILFGIAVGDALGVPVEFKSREEMRKKPVTDMTGYGTYNQQPGTWSDDSSLAFCVAEALITNNPLYHMGINFRKWAYESYWTPRGKVFDIGNTTRKAIANLANGKDIFAAGCFDEASNGNGSLMRILPMVVWTSAKHDIDEHW